jgi:hypothetical protein
MVQNRKECTIGARRCDPTSGREIAHCLVNHGRHSFGDVAEALKMRRDSLSRATSPYESEDENQYHQPGLTWQDVIVVTNLQDDHRLVEEVCRRTGGVFVPMPSAHDTDEDVYEALTTAVEELGQDSGVIRRILADRTVTSEEADHADREIDETIAALVKLKATVRRKVAKPTMLSTARKLS